MEKSQLDNQLGNDTFLFTSLVPSGNSDTDGSKVGVRGGKGKAVRLVVSKAIDSSRNTEVQINPVTLSNGKFTSVACFPSLE